MNDSLHIYERRPDKKAERERERELKTKMAFGRIMGSTDHETATLTASHSQFLTLILYT
jgi:hypothetical protein